MIKALKWRYWIWFRSYRFIFWAWRKDTRKPSTGMLKQYLTEEYNLKDSYVIGDRLIDEACSQFKLRCHLVLMNHLVQKGMNVDLQTDSWKSVYEFPSALTPATVDHARYTKERRLIFILIWMVQGKLKSIRALVFWSYAGPDSQAWRVWYEDPVRRSDLHIDEPTV